LFLFLFFVFLKGKAAKIWSTVSTVLGCRV